MRYHFSPFRFESFFKETPWQWGWGASGWHSHSPLSLWLRSGSWGPEIEAPLGSVLSEEGVGFRFSFSFLPRPRSHSLAPQGHFCALS